MYNITGLLIFLVIVLLFVVGRSENFGKYINNDHFNIPNSGYTITKNINDIIPLKQTDDGGYVRLYEDFNKNILPMNSRYWQFPDKEINYRNKYIRAIIPIKLKAYDINVPKFTIYSKPKWMSKQQMDEYNKMRKVEIYSMYPQYINASSSTGGVYSSTYVEPKIWKKNGGDLIDAFEYNTGKYKKIITVNAGEHKEGVILEPVRKIIIFGVL